MSKDAIQRAREQFTKVLALLVNICADIADLKRGIDSSNRRLERIERQIHQGSESGGGTGVQP